MSFEIYLECVDREQGHSRRFDVLHFPARIGRYPDCEVHLESRRISRRHAELRRDERGDLEIRDLDSTNGTYVNGEQIAEPTLLFDGDVLHIGDREFRVVQKRTAGASSGRSKTQIGIGTLPNRFPVTVREFNELLERDLVTAYRQAIVDHEGRIVACELLGRGVHPSLAGAPGPLFQLARTLGREIALSELMRRHAFALAESDEHEGPWFFNIHPHEMRDPERLLTGLRDLRRCHPALALVLEVHETAVTDKTSVASLRRELRAMEIALAYDDFGAGQARLQELIEVPPDYLKFDISLIRGITEAGSARRRMLESLNGMIRDLGIPTLAEGIEDARTAEICREIGIDLLQGYYCGRPEPLE